MLRALFAGAMHMPDKSAPHIHPDVRIEDKRPESCTKKREAVQGKVRLCVC